jgi:hypothetical protein
VDRRAGERLGRRDSDLTRSAGGGRPLA